MTDTTHADVIIIGAGIAGASLASRLSERHHVVVLEQETAPGYHATGRSAALVSETYGSAVVRGLSRATMPFLSEPPAGFCDAPLLRRCGVLFIAREDQRAALEDFAGARDVKPITRRVTGASAHMMVPILRSDYVAEAVLEPGAAEIDVHGLHHGYLKLMRSRQGRLVTDAAVTHIDRARGSWRVGAAGQVFVAPIVVNAAGAWADVIAHLAGVTPIGFQPLRRTVATIDSPPDVSLDSWPMVVDIDETFYLKPDAGRLLISPADETASEPCDAQPDEYDVAVAVDRIEQATTLQVRHIRSKWAGLRTFSPDRNPVIGADPTVNDFFWLAGQGGYGIQTSYGAARLAAALLMGEAMPSELVDAGLDAEALAPSRFADGATPTQPAAAAS